MLAEGEIELEIEAKAQWPLLLEIRANLFQSNTLAHIRDTLLPNLISGKLRVPDAEKLAEEIL